jgi:hypothetical protein
LFVEAGLSEDLLGAGVLSSERPGREALDAAGLLPTKRLTGQSVAGQSFSGSFLLDNLFSAGLVAERLLLEGLISVGMVVKGPS